MDARSLTEVDFLYYGFRILGAVLEEIWGVQGGTLKGFPSSRLRPDGQGTDAQPRLGFGARFGPFSKENGPPGGLSAPGKRALLSRAREGPFWSFSGKFS